MTQKKKDTIKSLAIHSKDVGSTEIQIGLLTDKISKLSEHFKKFKKDHVSHKLINKTNIKMSSDNLSSKLKKLTKLYKSGTLSKTEFEKAKEKLLK